MRAAGRPQHSLDLQSNSGGGLANLRCKSSSRTGLYLLCRGLKQCEILNNSGVDGFERLLQHQAIHGYDGEGCVVRLEKQAMPRSHLVNEALHVEGYWFRRRHGSPHLNPI